MKIIISLSFLFFFAFVNAQIPNFDFSSWTDMTSYSVPDNWGNLNLYTNSSEIYTCTEGTPGVPSTNFLILTNQNVPGKGVVPGKAVSGDIDTVTFEPKNGFPFTARPIQLEYIVQYMPFDASDPPTISVYLTKWNNVTNQRDTIASGYSEFLGMVHIWTPGYTTLNYYDVNFPDTACIVISSSKVNPLAGGYLYIDDLTFTGNANGVAESEEQLYFTVFPIPGDDLITLEFQKEISNGEIIVFNSLGKLLISTVIRNKKILINTEAWDSGVYFVKVKYDGKTSYGKIIIH